ncbi:hypothetical protein SLEP1_g16996 [Rubroshorea leprosula]|uniref:Stress-related protein n=1 Tax=Rubroshorea leprosula TaxID=152421 RepID=A0AAV5J1T6_9ROSI|nr:hypothetical protein SLEP1_g16996 [Rubroshorea leprosula]
MAESGPKQQIPTTQDNEKKLKYLDFVLVAVIYGIVCIISLYEFAKENSGPLKSGVQAVEDTVKTVIGPVYEKFHDVPFELLRFVDRKVDDSLREVDRHVPCLVKQASFQARAVVSEVQRDGLVDAANKISKNVYTQYEPVAEQYAVSAWLSLNRLPLFPQVAQIALPTAAYWSEKYNLAVSYTGERGYPLASYLPLIPIERIAKVFQDGENEPSIVTNGGAVMAE